MKRIIIFSLAMVLISSVVFGASLNLRATWTANTEPDMKEYRLYRLDGGRVLLGTIPHPNTSFDFTLSVPDGTEGTLRFVLTAVDAANNESADSNEATYPFDLRPPAQPSGFGVSGR